MIQLHIYFLCQLVFEAKVLKNNSVSVAGFDDVYMTTDDCRQSDACNYEHDLCSWSNSLDDTADWMQQSPADALPGPPLDHSINSIYGVL